MNPSVSADYKTTAAIGVPVGPSPQLSSSNMPMQMPMPMPMPMPQQQAPPPSRQPVPWSTGICGCFSDIPNCCITCFCPCVTFGQIAEIVDRGSSSCGQSGALYALIQYVTGCAHIYSRYYRTKMREQYGIQGNCCTDMLAHSCCEPCALCQEYRELKNRGYNMSLGWHGNLERQNRGVVMAPVVQGGMIR